MQAVIFIGIPASGKSTFYMQNFFSTHIRINLDMLKTRRREEILLQACIQAKQPFVVDNTNVLREERARYILPAKAARFKICGYYFQSPLKEALQRNSQRAGKAQIPEKGILAKFGKLQPPTYEEGYDELYRVSIGSGNQFTVTPWAETGYAK